MIYGIDYSTRTMNGLSMEPAEPESLRCGSCGKVVAAVEPCVWDTDLMVGSCCETYIDHKCPDCGSDALEFREYAYGMDRETGYRDSGERAICRACGHDCDIRDTEVKIGPARPGITVAEPDCDLTTPTESVPNRNTFQEAA